MKKIKILTQFIQASLKAKVVAALIGVTLVSVGTIAYVKYTDSANNTIAINNKGGENSNISDSNNISNIDSINNTSKENTVQKKDKEEEKKDESQKENIKEADKKTDSSSISENTSKSNQSTSSNNSQSNNNTTSGGTGTVNSIGNGTADSKPSNPTPTPAPKPSNPTPAPKPSNPTPPPTKNLDEVKSLPYSGAKTIVHPEFSNYNRVTVSGDFVTLLNQTVRYIASQPYPDSQLVVDTWKGKYVGGKYKVRTVDIVGTTVYNSDFKQASDYMNGTNGCVALGEKKLNSSLVYDCYIAEQYNDRVMIIMRLMVEFDPI